MITILKRSVNAAFVAALIFSSSSALAGGNSTYHVTITNLTNSINFTPILVTSHRKPVSIFDLGFPATDELSMLAEAGDIGPMTTLLNANSQVVDVQSSAGLLGPGASVTVIVSARRGAKHISLASMMLPTNDGFIGLDSVRVPKHGNAIYFSPAYDAGTEPNDELCANIPGPTCGGVGKSPGKDDNDEGYVHIHRGIHGIGDIKKESPYAHIYDWRNPVAKITITRIRKK
jgi:hypothetical protein